MSSRYIEFGRYSQFELEFEDNMKVYQKSYDRNYLVSCPIEPNCVHDLLDIIRTCPTRFQEKRYEVPFNALLLEITLEKHNYFPTSGDKYLLPLLVLLYAHAS